MSVKTGELRPQSRWRSSQMKTAFKSIVAALAVSATAFAAPAYAQRGNNGNGNESGWNPAQGSRIIIRKNNHHWPKHHFKRRHKPHVVYRYRDNDAAAAAALLGIAGAAIIGSAIANQPMREIYVQPQPHAYPPQPTGPNVITYESSLEPWTTGWYRWCDANYRSFDPRKGTFRGYDGKDHFCVPH
jgi:hypothetical protein